MAQITGTVSLTFRHRWLGMAFIAVTCAPFVLLGSEPSEETTKRLVGVAYRLMGPKVTIS